MTLKVLVVDDNIESRERVGSIVTDVGCEVVYASNGFEAIAIATAEQPGLIFMDVVMPGMSGYAVCRRLHRNPVTTDIPVVFISNRATMSDYVWAMKQGARGFMDRATVDADVPYQLAMAL